MEQDKATSSPWHVCTDQIECDNGHKYDLELGGGRVGRSLGTKLLLSGLVRASDSHKTILRDCEGGSGKCLPCHLGIVTVLPFV